MEEQILMGFTPSDEHKEYKTYTQFRVHPRLLQPGEPFKICRAFADYLQKQLGKKGYDFL